MSTAKRKPLETQLQRRVRPRRSTSEEIEYDIQQFSSQISDLDEGNKPPDGSLSSSSESKSSEIGVDDSLSSSESEVEEATLISFGALAKAQEQLEQSSKKRKISTLTKDNGSEDREKTTWEDNELLERNGGRKDRRDFTRTNKHAPAELSSKRAVSRKREVVPVPKRETRDPRFEPLGTPLDEAKIQKAYSFLDAYREDEMRELKNNIKQTKDEFEKERLKQMLLSMESRKKAQDQKKKQAEILDRHRKEEKELVKQGKKPFYLKKTEQRKRLLIDRFSELKGKQLDRVLERRRKKIEGKEKKKLPWSRRESEG